MSEMIDRVAMAIANADDGTMVDPKLGWHKCDELMREDYRKEARAAIAAMRVPTANMVDNAPFSDVAETTWEFMIDEALK